MPGLRARSQTGGVREATDGCLCMAVPLPPFLSLKISKWNPFKKTKTKNKTSTEEIWNILGFIDSSIRQHHIWQVSGSPEKLYRTEDFYGHKLGGAVKLSAKERGVSGNVTFQGRWWSWGEGFVFSGQLPYFLLGGMEGPTDRLPHWYWPENLDGAINVAFLEKAETAGRLGIKSRFGVMGFSRSDSIWGLPFSL